MSTKKSINFFFFISSDKSLNIFNLKNSHKLSESKIWMMKKKIKLFFEKRRNKRGKRKIDEKNLN
ncbi:MAG: hypothetical protein CMP38_04815 [Rickettsiales bacterium]|nr:hypothetical protein [Rickettsiales bacterium]